MNKGQGTTPNFVPGVDRTRTSDASRIALPLPVRVFDSFAARLRKGLNMKVIGPESVVEQREETAYEHAANAAQILQFTDPLKQSPLEVRDNILAAEARLLKCLMQLDKEQGAA